MRDIKLMIKHTFKESYKTMLILNGIILGTMFLISLFVLIFNVNFLVSRFGIILMGLGILTVVVMVYAVIIFFFFNIYKTMKQKLFTNEGYLTFTLPVSVDSLIISKIFVSIVWELLIAVVVFVGLGMISCAAIIKNAEDIVLDGLFNIIDFKALFSGIRFIDVIIFIYGLCMSIVTSIAALLFLFVSIAVANCFSFKKGKGVLAIFLYVFGIDLVASIITIVSLYCGIGITYDMSSDKYYFAAGFLEYGVYSINFTLLLLFSGLVVGLYFLAKYLLKKKIELV